MTTKRCYYKPNRSEPRKFNENDLDRIARYVHEGGVPWFTILGVIAVSGGFAWLICRTRNWIDIVRDVGEWLNELVDVVAIIGAINVMLRVLRVGAGIPLAGRVIALLIGFFVATLVFLRKVSRYQRELRDGQLLLEVKSFLDGACEAANDRIEWLYAQGQEAKIGIEDRLTARGDLPPA